MVLKKPMSNPFVDNADIKDRLAQAASLIKTTHRTVGDISSSTGFDNYGVELVKRLLGERYLTDDELREHRKAVRTQSRCS